jgi:hypothetical protein
VRKASNEHKNVVENPPGRVTSGNPRMKWDDDDDDKKKKKT